MRRWFAFLAVPFLVAGCSAKYEAKTGKEFFEKLQKAAKDKDAETIWKMVAKKDQDKQVEHLKKRLEEAKTNEATKKSLVEHTGIADPTSKKPEELAIASLKKSLEDPKGDTNFGKWTFVKEAPEGDTVILTTKEGDKEEELVLVKENGYLKMSWEATGERAMKKFEKKP